MYAGQIGDLDGATAGLSLRERTPHQGIRTVIITAPKRRVRQPWLRQPLGVLRCVIHLVSEVLLDFFTCVCVFVCRL